MVDGCCASSTECSDLIEKKFEVKKIVLKMKKIMIPFYIEI